MPEDRDAMAMHWHAEIRAALSAAHAVDDDVVDELAEHAADLFADGQARGMSAETAQRSVLEQIGRWRDDSAGLRRPPLRGGRKSQGPKQAGPHEGYSKRPHNGTSATLASRPAESALATRLLGLAEAFLVDALAGLRAARRAPRHTLLIVLCLGLGCGLATAAFSAVDALVLRPLPYADQDRLIDVASLTADGAIAFPSYPDYADWRARATSFSGLAARMYETFNLATADGAEQVNGAIVTGNLFEVLGVQMQLGRTFTTDEERPDGPGALVVTEESWHQRFGGSTDVVGRTMTLDGMPFRIVGVLPAGFRFPVADERGEFFAPIGRVRDELANRRFRRGLGVIGRLTPEASLPRARTELTTIAAALAVEHPDTNRDVGVRVTPYLDVALGSQWRHVWLIVGIAGCLLVIAAVNGSGLIVERAYARETEFGVRRALGASWSALLRQLLAEGAVVASFASIVCLLVATAGARVLAHVLALPRASAIAIDGRSAAFGVAAAFIVAIACSAMPIAWIADRASLPSGLSEGARVISCRGRRGLVLVQIALCEALVVLATFMGVSYRQLAAVETGFTTARILTANYYLSDGLYAEYEQIVGFHRRLLAAVETLPGVTGAGLMAPPLFATGRSSTEEMTIETGGSRRVQAATILASPSLFETLDIAVVDGRPLTDKDVPTRGRPEAILVDRRFASEYFPGRRSIGAVLRSSSGQPLEIVGVVATIKTRALDEPAVPLVYRPLYGRPAHFAALVVRTWSDDSERMVPALRRTAARLDPRLPLYDVATLAARVDASVVGARTRAMLSAVLTLIAWVLAVYGAFVLVVFAVRHRRREIGIRMMLGASRWSVFRLIAGSTGASAAIGVVMGGALGAFVLRLVRPLLFSAVVIDPLVIVAISLGLLATTLLAGCLPVRRITATEPAATLRD